MSHGLNRQRNEGIGHNKTMIEQSIVVQTNNNILHSHKVKTMKCSTKHIMRAHHVQSKDGNKNKHNSKYHATDEMFTQLRSTESSNKNKPFKFYIISNCLHDSFAEQRFGNGSKMFILTSCFTALKEKQTRKKHFNLQAYKENIKNILKLLFLQVFSIHRYLTTRKALTEEVYLSWRNQ